MSELLFDVEVVESPRLKWMKRHGVEVSDNPLFGVRNTGRIQYPIRAMDSWSGAYASAETEEDAVVDLARARGLRLWNEEGRG